MRFFGLTISREKAAPAELARVDDRGGWRSVIRESFTGAWQKNVEVDQKSVIANHAVFACMTRIARDVGKLRVKLVAQDSDGLWSEVTSSAYSPVLRKPNSTQTRNQFMESWMLSKLATGNTYVLKERDNRNVVVALYVLDPARVKPLVTPDGGVYYELSADNMAGLQEASVVVPASEIMHDRFNCLFHPLVGVSPIYASGLAATQGLHIQNNSANLFGNASRPGGLLTAPGRIDEANATRLKEMWDSKYTGGNVGKVAILGDGLKYEALSINPVDAQLVEQLKWTAEVVCSTFHVPPYKVGVGAMPSVSNVQALNIEYYSQCLQSHFEDIESVLDEGLRTGEKLGTEFDTENLFRMDSGMQMDVLEKSKSALTLDERRRKLGYGKITGGDTVYLQMQDHSIEAIAARDALLIEQANNPQPAAAPVNDEPSETQQEQARAMTKALLEKLVRERLDA